MRVVMRARGWLRRPECAKMNLIDYLPATCGELFKNGFGMRIGLLCAYAARITNRRALLETLSTIDLVNRGMQHGASAIGSLLAACAWQCVLGNPKNKLAVVICRVEAVPRLAMSNQSY
jgi:hypothetical protein